MTMESKEATRISRRDLWDTLNRNILHFWESRMVDHQNGGFYGRIDGEGILHENADKSVILNTRILWTFSAAFQLTQQPEHKKIADRAFDYINRFFVDTKHGGVFWMVNAEGKVVNDKKQVYALAFAIYALAEYHKISPDSKALDLAKTLFVLLEKNSFDTARNGYFEAFDVVWQPMTDVRLSDKDMNATKTMNTHLHVLEAYTNLLQVWPDEHLRAQLKNLIQLMKGRFLSSSHHFNLFFDDHWNLLSDEISFGHDIEGSWLLCEAADVLGEKRLMMEVQDVAIKMTWAALEGMDDDGGLMNEASPRGITDTDKHWWPQAEALVGLVNAWQITGNRVFLAKADNLWRFISEYILDSAGEWHWKVFRNGKVDASEDKAGPWKCPYHNGRAMIELYRRLA